MSDSRLWHELLTTGIFKVMTVKELLGHKSLNMTLRYADLAPAHKVKAMEMLDFNGRNQTYFTGGG